MELFDFRVINRFSKETTNAGDVVYLPEETTYLWRGKSVDTVGFVAFDMPFGLPSVFTLGHDHWYSDKPRIVVVMGNAESAEDAQAMVEEFHQNHERAINSMTELSNYVRDIKEMKKGSLALTMTGEYLYHSAKGHKVLMAIHYSHTARELACVEVEKHTRFLSQEPVIQFISGIEHLGKAIKEIESMPTIDDEMRRHGNKIVFRMANIRKEMVNA